jgi:hypothetical protein
MTFASDISDVTWKNPQIAPKRENQTFDLFTATPVLCQGTELKSTLPCLAKNQSVITFEMTGIG